MKQISAAAVFAAVLMIAVPIFEPGSITISGDDVEPILAPLPAPKVAPTYATAASTWTVNGTASYTCSTAGEPITVATSTSTIIPVVVPGGT